MLVFHISHLEEGELARDMLEEQVRHGWPGLVVEVSRLCDKLRLEDARLTLKTREQYAKDVVTACKWRDEALMKEQMEGKKEKKMRIMYHDNMDMKDYVKHGNLYTARTTWEVRSHMLRPHAGGRELSRPQQVRRHRVAIPGLPAPGAGEPGAPDQLHGLRGLQDWPEPDSGGRAGELCHERDGQKEGEGMGLGNSFWATYVAV